MEFVALWFLVGLIIGIASMTKWIADLGREWLKGFGLLGGIIAIAFCALPYLIGIAAMWPLYLLSLYCERRRKRLGQPDPRDKFHMGTMGAED